MNVSIDWLPLAIAFATSVVATGVVRTLAMRVGKTDEPDPARRLHTRPTPRLGGVGIAAGLAAAVVFSGLERRLPATAQPFVVVLAAALVVGLWDDIRPRGKGLPAVVKLCLQIGVGGLAVFSMLEIDILTACPPWGTLALGGWTLPLTVAWIVAVMNVVNFMDGSDAIAGSIAAVILAAAGAAESVAMGGLLVTMAAATTGFLVWNAPPAKIFMGDGGSHLLGAAVALAPCATLDDSLWVPGAPWPLVGAALLPSILDVAEALIHKARHGIPMSQAHHDHLYQRLVKATGSHGLVAIRYGVLALLAVLVAGPFAERFGALAAGAVGGAILAAHWIDGVRRARGVPRLGAK